MILGSDGWEHANAYHWLTNQAAQGNIAVIMPDTQLPNGQIAIYRRAYDPSMRTLLHPKQHMRAAALLAFAKVGHMVAEEEMTR